jgi:RNA polymerase sigma factor (sigma-70 family)
MDIKQNLKNDIMGNRKKIDINSAEFNEQLASYLNGKNANINMVFGNIQEESTRIASLVIGKMGIRNISKVDLVQDISIKLLNGGLNNYNPEKGTFSGWLYQVIKNQILTEIRNEKKGFEESYDAMKEVERDIILESVVDDDNDTEIYKSRMDAITQCLEVLTPYERSVIEGILSNPSSIQALGEELGRDGNWVSGLKKRAIEKIKKEIRRRGLME